MNQHGWQVSEMECDKCGSRQISVHPETCEYLECHVCHHMMPAPYIPPSQSVMEFTTEYRVTLWGWMSELHQPKVSSYKSLKDAMEFINSLYPHLRPDIIWGPEATRIEMFDNLAHPSAGTMVTIQANIVRVE